MSEKLGNAAAVIGQHMDRIRSLVFRPEYRDVMLLTFIARDPTNPESDIFVSEDDIEGVIDLLRRSVDRETVASPEPAQSTAAKEPRP